MNYIQIHREKKCGGAIFAKDVENSFQLTFKLRGNDTVVFR